MVPSRAVDRLAVVAAAAVAAAPLRGEAVRAVHGLVATWLERHPRLVATARAGRREHLALLSAVATAGAVAATAVAPRAVPTGPATALGLAGRPAVLAARGLVLEALR